MGMCSRKYLLQKIFLVIFGRFEVALSPKRERCFEAPVRAGVFLSVKIEDQVVLIRISGSVRAFITSNRKKKGDHSKAYQSGSFSKAI